MKWFSACLAGLALASGSAAAQLILFEHDNFGGRRMEIYGPTPDFAATGTNDLASSAIVERGQWTLCENGHYGGRCITLRPGNYASLGQFGLNDAISSARPEGGGGGGSRPPGSGGGGRDRVVLYEGFNFTGRSYTFDRSMFNLDGVSFNDRAQSAMVMSGTWTLCENAQYQGTCQVFGPGNYASLGELSRRVSSLRQGEFGGSVGTYPPDWGGQARVILFESPDFGGRQFVIDRNRFDNLDGTGFNDRASSLRVERGYWMFCSDANLNGECRTYGPGNYQSLPPRLNNAISSGRRISEQYPYNQSPVWGSP